MLMCCHSFWVCLLCVALHCTRTSHISTAHVCNHDSCGFAGSLESFRLQTFKAITNGTGRFHRGRTLSILAGGGENGSISELTSLSSHHV